MIPTQSNMSPCGKQVNEEKVVEGQTNGLHDSGTF